MSGKLEGRSYVGTPKNFQSTHIGYRAHRAVIFAIAWHLVRLITAKINIFSFLAAGFCPKNLAFARKLMVLPESGGLQPPNPPGSYAYGHLFIEGNLTWLDLIAGAMCAQHIRRHAVSEDIVGGRTSRHWTGVSGDSAGQCSDHTDRPVHVGHLQQWTSQRR